MSDDQALEALSHNLTRFLAEKNVSQRELARQIGDSVMTISSIVHGKHMPLLGVVTRISEALQVGLDDLLAPPQRKKNRTAAKQSA